MMDIVSTCNYHIRLIESPAKDIVVHHNWLKFCYVTPQKVPVPSSTSSAPDRLYSDIVRNSTRTSAG